MNDTMKKRILFVDDEPMILKGIQQTLRKMQDVWDMTFASSAAEALAVLDNNPMDVIISDMKMPEMDGHEFLRELRQFNTTVPVLISTAYGDYVQQDFSAWLSNGYSVKSGDLSELIAKVKEILGD